MNHKKRLASCLLCCAGKYLLTSKVSYASISFSRAGDQGADAAGRAWAWGTYGIAALAGKMKFWPIFWALAQSEGH